MKPTLLVLAAGMGSRYGGLKQIDPVGEDGETIIDFSIYDAVNSGFDKVVFVIRRDIEKEFREVIGRKCENKINVEYVFQQLEDIPGGFKVPADRVKPWGTGHAILSARKAINNSFAVINGDDFYGSKSFFLLANFLDKTDSSSNEYAIVAYILRNTLSEHGSVSRGVCSVQNKYFLKDITEYTKIKKSGEKIVTVDNNGKSIELAGDEYVSMNMFGFTAGIFKYLESEFIYFLKNNADNPKSEFYIPSVVSTLINSNRATVRILQSDSTWLGITYQEDKDHVRKSIRNLIAGKQYPPKLW
jgi:UTP-glucose-1-phosphate uridylyltransferase